MVGKSKPANQSEKARMSLIKEQAWCIPCILNRTPDRPATTIQHVVSGNKRLGHRYTYGCCGWHHLGDDGGLGRFESMKMFGPSLALGSREYHEVWGSEKILVLLQDYLIELYLESGPWEQYHLPHHIGREVRVRWQEMKGLR